MRKLKSLSYSKLSTTQLHFFATSLLGIIEPIHKNDQLLQKQYTIIRKTCDAIQELLSFSKKNEKTNDLLEADALQDEVLRGIREYLKGLIALRHFNKAKAIASESILNHFRSFGREMLYGGYDKQAALIPSFIKSIKGPDFSPIVETTGITHLIDELEQNHKKVQTLYSEKLQVKVRPNTSIKKEKRVLQYRIGLLLPYLEMNLADEIPAFAPIKTPLNELITDVMRQYQTKQTRKRQNAS